RRQLVVRDPHTSLVSQPLSDFQTPSIPPLSSNHFATELSQLPQMKVSVCSLIIVTELFQYRHRLLIPVLSGCKVSPLLGECSKLMVGKGCGSQHAQLFCDRHGLLIKALGRDKISTQLRY